MLYYNLPAHAVCHNDSHDRHGHDAPLEYGVYLLNEARAQCTGPGFCFFYTTSTGFEKSERVMLKFGEVKGFTQKHLFCCDSNLCMDIFLSHWGHAIAKALLCHNVVPRIGFVHCFFSFCRFLLLIFACFRRLAALFLNFQDVCLFLFRRRIKFFRRRYLMRSGQAVTVTERCPAW